MSLSDDQQDIDALLRRAGADWRQQQPPPPEPDLSRARELGRRSRRWLLPAVAAASIAVVVLTLTFMVTRPGTEPTNPVGQGPQQSSASDLIVHDGDTVEVTGQVIAVPGQAVVFCPPYASARDPEIPVPRPGETPAPEATSSAATCPAKLAVTLTGVDLERLSSPATVQHTRTGQATLRGTWHGRSIDVTEQTAPRQATPVSNDAVPCPAPADGWKVDNLDRAEERNALDAYVKARPERFSNGRIAYVDTPSNRKATVMVIPVASGDLDATQRELEAFYQGNMCITRGVLSIAESRRVAERVVALINDNTGASVSGVSESTRTGQVRVNLFMVTEQALEQFSEIGLDKLELNPVVRPAR
jgi:hypothetical protein